jgi:toxin ParE1/3/4
MAKFEYHILAESEVDEAFDWYRDRSHQAAANFLEELERAIDQVIRYPDRWPVYLHGTRRYKLSRFPYVLVYLLRDDTVVGIAVAHLSRKPGYWRRRLK